MKILLFAPNALLYPHTEVETDLSANLLSQDHEVIFLRCGEILENYCLSMEASGLNLNADSDSKKAICRRCISASRLESWLLNTNHFTMMDYETPESRKQSREISESQSFENLLQYQADGIPIGKFAIYETLIRTKANSLDIGKEGEERFRKDFEKCLRVFFAGKKFFETQTFDFVIVYNDLYGINRTFVKLAQAFGIPYMAIQLGGLLGTVNQKIVVNSSFFLPELENVRNWDSFRDLPLLEWQIDLVIQHLVAHFQAISPWVYSSGLAKNRNTKPVLNLIEELKVQKVFLLTLSSADENFAAAQVGSEPILQEIQPHLRQLTVLEDIINIFRSNPQLGLIIRPHPREFPNSREDVTSSQAKQLSGLFQNLPSNIIVNWPSQQISVFDFVGRVHGVMNISSSVGAELAALGVPLFNVDPVQLTAYSNDIGVSVNNLATDLLGSLLGGDYETSKYQTLAFRWIYFMNERATFRESPSQSNFPRVVLQKFRKVNARFGAITNLGIINWLRLGIGWNNYELGINSYSLAARISHESSGHDTPQMYLEHSSELDEAKKVRRKVDELLSDYLLS